MLRCVKVLLTQTFSNKFDPWCAAVPPQTTSASQEGKSPERKGETRENEAGNKAVGCAFSSRRKAVRSPSRPGPAPATGSSRTRTVHDTVRLDHLAAPWVRTNTCVHALTYDRTPVHQ